MFGRYSEPKILLKYAQWALERDEEMAARIFTERDDPFPLSPNKILEFLSPFPLATVSYLEYAIHTQATKVTLAAALI